MSGEVEERVVGRKKRIWNEGEREKELEREEVRCAIKSVKKMTGMDRITEEVWKYEGEEVERWL